MNAVEIPVLILAGGKGTRIKHLLNELPKPMFPVLGVPFLDYQLSYLNAAGFKKFYISTGYQAEVIEDYYATNPDVFCIKEEEPLGTGGAILKCLQKMSVSDKVLVLNGDTLFLIDYFPFIELSSSKGDHSIIALKKERDTSRYGSVKLESDKAISSFSEKIESATYSLINAGIYLLATEQLKNLNVPEICSMETDVFPILTQRKIFGYEIDAEFIDIGTPETLFLIEQFVQKNNIKPL